MHKSRYLVAALSVARVDAQLAAEGVGLGQGVVEAVLAVVAEALELQSVVVGRSTKVEKKLFVK